MSRLRYRGPSGAFHHTPDLTISMPDPASLEVPAIQEAAGRFRLLEAQVETTWTALVEARAALETAEAADRETRLAALREGNTPPKPRGLTREAKAAAEDAEAVHEDAKAVFREAAWSLAHTVRDNRDAILIQVAEESGPIQARLAELQAEARPLAARLKFLHEWTELEYQDPGGRFDRGTSLARQGGHMSAIHEADPEGDGEGETPVARRRRPVETGPPPGDPEDNTMEPLDDEVVSDG